MRVGNSNIKDILIGENPIVKIYKGLEVVWKRNELPDGYTRVEYLESTGTQYIDTGILCNNDINVIIDFSLPQSSLTNTRNYIIGCYGNDNSGRTQFSYSQTAFCGWGNAYATMAVNVDTSEHIISISKNSFNLDGNTIYTPTSENFTLKNYIYLFAVNVAGGSASNFVSAKIYSCKIWDNDTLVRDLIPCLDDEYVPCMYDRVTQRTFYNAGTGEFLYGEIN